MRLRSNGPPPCSRWVLLPSPPPTRSSTSDVASGVTAADITHLFAPAADDYDFKKNLSRLNSKYNYRQKIRLQI